MSYNFKGFNFNISMLK